MKYMKLASLILVVFLFLTCNQKDEFVELIGKEKYNGLKLIEKTFDELIQSKYPNISLDKAYVKTIEKYFQNAEFSLFELTDENHKIIYSDIEKSGLFYDIAKLSDNNCEYEIIDPLSGEKKCFSFTCKSEFFEALEKVNPKNKYIEVYLDNVYSVCDISFSMTVDGILYLSKENVNDDIIRKVLFLNLYYYVFFNKYELK